MSLNPGRNESKDKSAKSSSWKIFSKSRRRSTDLKAENTDSNRNSTLQPPPDSTYASSGEHSNSLNSEANTSGQPSLNISNNPSSQHQLTPTSLPNDETRIDSTPSHTGPAIRKETHHNPATGTTVTTTVTTTTTTTIVAGPNGTTTIEEPRVELPGGQTTPNLPQQSEAVAAAIQVVGNDSTQNSEEAQRNSVTPGQRPIPYRDPKSMSDVRRAEDRPTSLQPGEAPTIPFRSSNRLSYQPPATPNNGAQTGNGPVEGDKLPGVLRAGPRPVAGPGSTLANLKTAAAGIHGAAETLRGTVSSTADRRLRASKATDADFAKHQDIINTGKYEIENGQFASRHSVYPSNDAGHRGAPATIPSSSTTQPPVITPHPDALGNRKQRSSGQLRRRSWGNRAVNQPQKPDTGNRMSKWLRKASSHPSDRGDAVELRESTNF